MTFNNSIFVDVMLNVGRKCGLVPNFCKYIEIYFAFRSVFTIFAPMRLGTTMEHYVL